MHVLVVMLIALTLVGTPCLSTDQEEHATKGKVLWCPKTETIYHIYLDGDVYRVLDGVEWVDLGWEPLEKSKDWHSKITTKNGWISYEFSRIKQGEN